MSAGVLGGVALAAGAAACFDAAVALQALDARRVGTPGVVSPGLIVGLARRRRWLVATGLALAGWPLQVGALALAPLAVVQPTLALGLVLLLYLGARLLGEPAGPRELGAVAAIVVGVGVLAWAAPEPSDVHAASATLAAVLGALGALAALPWLLRRQTAGGVLVLAAGAGYAASALTSKLLADALAGPQWVAALAWAALTGVLAGLGLGDEMAALQRLSAAAVATGAFVAQTVVPVLLAPLLFEEPWSDTSLGGLAVAGGLLAVAGGSAVLAAAPGVRRLVAGAHGPSR